MFCYFGWDREKNSAQCILKSEHKSTAKINDICNSIAWESADFQSFLAEVYGIKVLVFSKGIFVGALWGSTWRVPVKNPNKDRHTDNIFVYFVCPFSNSNILPCEIQDNMPQGNAKVLQTFL